MKRVLTVALVIGLSATIGGCALFGSWWGPKRAAWRSEAERACLTAGAVQPSADVRPMGEIDGPGTCGADRPFKVSAVGRRSKAPLNESTALNCPMVAAVDDWFDRIVQPAAEADFGQPVVGIEHMGSYNCRPIAGHRQMSEHAYMNALDVSGFKLADGRTVRVKNGWRSGDAVEVAFLNTVGAAACEDFTTVLGPDAGAAHADHIHLDLARHGQGRRVCKGGSEPVPEGGRLLSFFEGAERTGSVPKGSDGEDEDDPAALDR
ncbi:extensin family protein [Siculibacillus lacustris]|uniref:Extensin family protein n=1 Tax=Siculibacillus lacustris TaxID=1549641 RepID=A0A4Q9VS12_9HYPH|nr:extensin family protein [Siculibacillus lacustris]TBW38722.1 extensin family protein [Siculibacillus lacustris]